MKIIVKEGEMQGTTELIGLRPHISGPHISAARSIWASCMRTATVSLLALMVAACAAATPPDRPDEVYVKEAWAYFKKKCDTEAGEKIYKTFAGVKSVLVVKPLPPATEKDLFDQFWYGDPYSLPATSNRVIRAAGLLTLSSRKGVRVYNGLQFVEIENELRGYPQYQKVSSPPGRSDYLVENIEKPISRFGISWEDISDATDRKYWIAGSRFRVIDLVDNSLVAERIGYFIEASFGSKSGGRRPWLTSRGPNTTCPSVHSDYADQQFISRLFSLTEEK